MADPSFRNGLDSSPYPTEPSNLENKRKPPEA